MKVFKLKTCKICKTKFKPVKQFENWCSIECAIKIINISKAKAKKKRELKAKQEHRQAKENLKSKAEFLKEAQAVVNSYIRLRDSGVKCISCDSYPQSGRIGGHFDAGHYRSRGSAPHIRFYTLNIFMQCKQCNRYLSGNSVEMRKGIIERKGIEFVERIEAMYFDKKYSIEYLKRLKKVFSKKVRLLKRLRE